MAFKPLNAGDLKHKIEILNGSGQLIMEDYVWASFRMLSGQRLYTAYMAFAKYVAEIRCHYFKVGQFHDQEVTIGMRVRIDGDPYNVWDIQSVINVDDKNMEYYMTVTR